MNNKKWLLFFSLFMSSCAPTTQMPGVSADMTEREAAIQREIAIKELHKINNRLQSVAMPILVKNAELCDDEIVPYFGVDLQTYASVPKEFQKTYENLYALGEYPTVTGIFEKSPAEGRLKIGDMITAVDGKSLKKGTQGLKDFVAIKEGNVKAAPMSLTVDRLGKVQTVTVDPVLACSYPVVLDHSDALNAYANGSSIVITKGMMRFAESDTDLAMILGHELAHNTRSHIESRQGNALIGGLLGAVVTVATGVDVTQMGTDLGASAFSQGFEAEADYVGVYHAARAGYDIGNVANVWRRFAAEHPQSIHMAGGTHPSTAARFVAIEQAVQEVQLKKKSGKRLVPEEKKQNSEVSKPLSGD